jgi:hypothetical protein
VSVLVPVLLLVLVPVLLLVLGIAYADVRALKKFFFPCCHPKYN